MLGTLIVCLLTSHQYLNLLTWLMQRCILWRRWREGVQQECCMSSMRKWTSRKAWHCESRPAAQWRVQIRRSTLAREKSMYFYNGFVDNYRWYSLARDLKRWWKFAPGHSPSGPTKQVHSFIALVWPTKEERVWPCFNFSFHAPLNTGPPGKNIPGVLCHQV